MTTYYALDPLAVGDVVCRASPAFPDTIPDAVWLKLALPDALEAAGAPLSIVRTAAEEGAKVDIWRRTHGDVPSAITGLSGSGFARVSTLGRPELVAALAAGDSPLGTVDSGRLTLDPRGPVEELLAVGGLVPTAVQTADFNASVGQLVRCDPTAGKFKVYLPTAVGVAGMLLEVWNVSDSTGEIGVLPIVEGQTINGQDSYSHKRNRQRTAFRSDGANWLAEPHAGTVSTVFDHTDYSTAEVLFWGEPSSMVVNAGVVTAWNNMAPGGLTFIGNGSVPHNTAGAFPGIGPFTSVGQYLQAVMSESDEEITIVAVTRQFDTTSGYLLDMSDSNSSNVSVSILNTGIGTRSGSYAGDGHAAYALADIGYVLEHYVFDAGGRRAWNANVHQADSNNPCAARRTVNKARLGDAVQVLDRYQGLWTALVILKGVPATHEIERNLATFRERYNTTELPELWPPPDASETLTDPRMILPEVAHTFVGDRLDIYKDCVHYRDGFTEQSATSDLPLIATVPDRWTVKPTVAGDYAFQVTEGAFTDSTVIRAVQPLAPGSPLLVFCMVGDSITEAGSIPWRFRKILTTTFCQMVGTIVTPSTGGVQHEGRGNRDWPWYRHDPASPFTDGAGALTPSSINAWIAALDAPPRVIPWILGTNDYRLHNDATIEGQINTSHEDAEELMAAISLQLPSVSHIIVPPFPGNADVVAWQFLGGEGGRQQFRRCMHRSVERIKQDFGGRSAERIYTCEPFVRVDPNRHYRGPTAIDPYHPTYVGGAQAIAESLAAMVTNNWLALVAP